MGYLVIYCREERGVKNWGTVTIYVDGEEFVSDDFELGDDEGMVITMGGGDDGYTPLHVAALGSSKDAALVLLEAGADVNERSSSGVTALQIAESRRDKELVRLLRDRGAEE